MSCNELIRILHLSSCATLDCLISEMAVTKVSMAFAYSPEDASVTARAIAELDTALLRFIVSSNSASEIAGGASIRGSP